MLNHCIFRRTTSQLLFCAGLQISTYIFKQVSLVYMDVSSEPITLLMCIDGEELGGDKKIQVSRIQFQREN